MPLLYKIKLSIRFIQMSLSRCIFIFGKNIFGSIDSTTCNNYTDYIDDKYNSFTKSVYDTLNESHFQKTSNKVFSFIHFTGCHSVVYDDEWNLLSSIQDSDIYYSVANSFKLINLFIQELKNNSLFESSIIIITGDHGASISDSSALEETMRTALFIKPSGSFDEPLQISQKQVSHKNIWPTIFKDLNIDCEYSQGNSVFEVPDGDVARKYVWHTYDSTGHTCDEYTYEINGPGRDFTSWTLIETKHYDKFWLD